MSRLSDGREFRSPSICPLNKFNLPPPQSDGFLKDNSNAAQRLLDGVNLVAQSVSELSVKPAKAVTSWLTDQIAPAYWKPNSLILVSDTRSLCRPLHRHRQPSQQSGVQRNVYWPALHLQQQQQRLLHNPVFAGPR